MVGVFVKEKKGLHIYMLFLNLISSNIGGIFMKTHILLALFSVFALCSCAMSGAKDTSSRTPQSANSDPYTALGVVNGDSSRSNRDGYNTYNISLTAKTFEAFNQLNGVDLIFNMTDGRITLAHLIGAAIDPYNRNDYQLNIGPRSFPFTPGEQYTATHQIVTRRQLMNSQVIVETTLMGSSMGHSSSVVVTEELRSIRPGRWESKNSSDDISFILSVDQQ